MDINNLNSKDEKLEEIVKDCTQKNTTIPMEGRIYQVKTADYESLMQILKETGTKIEEMQEFAENYESDKYFGIQIENESVTKLQINDYQLTAMPKEITQLTKLQRLDLENNCLTILPAEIGTLTELQYLDLGFNQITALPKEIMQLKSLQELTLTYNQLDKSNQNAQIIEELEEKGVDVLYLSDEE